MPDVHVALWVRLDAKPGKEKEVADFLRSGLAIVQEEPATTAWFAIQMAPSTFGIFDPFRAGSGGVDGEGLGTAGETSSHRKNRCAGRETAMIVLAK